MSQSDEDPHSKKLAFSSSYDQSIRPVIDLVDCLRSFGLDHDVDLPSVVVVGDQSSGKSSILEALSGVELPRGTGIVTRCPLVMELKKSNTWTATITTSGDPHYSRNVSKPENIKAALIDAQNTLAGNRKGISREEIRLRLASPTAADITLVDLPGITRIAVEDQTADIPQLIREIVQQYVQRENSLIMCVISGNLDVAVNESIRLAREWDPQGKRTLGVVTKPDLADTDDVKRSVVKLVNGEIIDLKKGFTVVKCRSTDEVGKHTLFEAQSIEEDFFKSDPIYRILHTKFTGTGSLASVLTRNLVELIKDKIPQMKRSVAELRQSTEEELERYSCNIPDDMSERKAYITGLIFSKFINQAKSCVVKGKLKDIGRSEDGSNYTRWRQLFAEFSESINDISDQRMRHDLKPEFFHEEIQRRQGQALTLMFISFDIIKDQVFLLLKAYISQANACVAAISNIVESVMSELVDKSFGHIPAFKTQLHEITNLVRLQQERDVTDRILFHFKEEKMVFTQKELLDFEIRIFAEKNPIDPADEMADAKKIGQLLDAYLKIMNRRLADQIPCCIMRVMHKEYIKHLEKNLQQLFKNDDFLESIVESDENAFKRKQLKDKLERLKISEMELFKF